MDGLQLKLQAAAHRIPINFQELGWQPTPRAFQARTTKLNANPAGKVTGVFTDLAIRSGAMTVLVSSAKRCFARHDGCRALREHCGKLRR